MASPYGSSGSSSSDGANRTVRARPMARIPGVTGASRPESTWSRRPAASHESLRIAVVSLSSPGRAWNPAWVSADDMSTSRYEDEVTLDRGGDLDPESWGRGQGNAAAVEADRLDAQSIAERVGERAEFEQLHVRIGERRVQIRSERDGAPPDMGNAGRACLV